MGVTYIDGIARGAEGQEQKVRFLVDSGARYSLLPKQVWESLGLRPDRELTFVLADGATVERGNPWAGAQSFQPDPATDAHGSSLNSSNLVALPARRDEC